MKRSRSEGLRPHSTAPIPACDPIFTWRGRFRLRRCPASSAVLRSVTDHSRSYGLPLKTPACYCKDYPASGSAVPLYMDKLLHDLGGIVLNALPTSLIVLILAIFIRQLYLKPLETVLAERHRLTEGARLAAEKSLHSADSKIADYQAALEKARGEIYAEQTEFLRVLHDEQTARTQAAKAKSDAALARSPRISGRGSRRKPAKVWPPKATS